MTCLETFIRHSDNLDHVDTHGAEEVQDALELLLVGQLACQGRRCSLGALQQLRKGAGQLVGEFRVDSYVDSCHAYHRPLLTAQAHVVGAPGVSITAAPSDDDRPHCAARSATVPPDGHVSLTRIGRDPWFTRSG